jgi:predicted site-specific integrase-resolvase
MANNVLIGMAQAAMVAGVSYWALRRATLAGRVPEPAHKIGRYRWYTADEVARLAAYFDPGEVALPGPAQAEPPPP